jgi:hypothetical protein
VGRDQRGEVVSAGDGLGASPSACAAMRLSLSAIW